MTRVAALADVGIEFHLSQEGQSELLCGPGAASLGKDVDLLVAMRTDEMAHVFDQANNLNFNLAEHFYGFARVLEGDIAGRGNYDGPTYGDSLNQRDGYVAGTGGQIDDQVLELSPIDSL